MSKKIEKFEDFIAWQKARQLSRKIYQATLPSMLIIFLSLNSRN